jgi:hypothetical protein
MKAMALGIVMLLAGIVTANAGPDESSTVTASTAPGVSALHPAEGKLVSVPQQSTLGDDQTVPMASLVWKLQFGGCSTSIPSTKKCPSGPSCTTAGDWCVSTITGTCGITGNYYSYYKCVSN